MSNRLGWIAGACLLALPLCGAPPALAEEAFQTPSLAPAELVKRREAGENLLVVDVRGTPEYRSGHVPGAVNIPPEQLPKHLDELRTASGVVLYCSNGHRTRTAERTLIDNRIEHLFHLEGGVFGWKTDGHDLKTGWAP